MPRRRRTDRYPATVAEVLDHRMKFRPEALRAVKRFARSGPWRGTLEERQAKFRRLNEELSAAYGLLCPALLFHRIGDHALSNGAYDPDHHAIHLVGKLSLVTYLHEFGHARGYGERRACRFSINLFRRVFPRSFARCRTDGHVLLNP
jgi:hypothetical protein